MKADFQFAISSFAIVVAFIPAVYAQEDNVKSYERIVVTGTPVGSTEQEASVSVSSFSEEDIYKLAPRSTAEVFRALPGIRAESSGGGGNANITIRGIPLATGGSKFLQIHEDGLPVLEFGDINFGNTDNFLRHDFGTGRVQAVRGGSASTFASNSPGGIINLISNTGEVEGGAIGTSFGVDYDEFRVDFAYGGEINDDLYYHISGHTRDGEGPRETGFNGDSGGQIRFNLTKVLDQGHLRFFFKNLDDNATTYLPAPVLVEGGGEFGPVPNFDASSETLHSALNTNISTFDSFGNPRNRDLTDGIESKVTSFGFEADLEVARDLYVLNRFRTSDITGGFISPFTDGFAGSLDPRGASGTAEQICLSSTDGDGNPFDCSSTTVTLANGPGAGNEFNGLAFTNLLFDVDFNDLGNTINDLNIRKEFDSGLSVTAGYYYSKQNIATSWNSWQVFIQTVDGTDSQLLNIADANGEVIVDNGLLSPSFLSFEWDLQYKTEAPYINIGYDLSDKWQFDVSARREQIQANGELISSFCGGNADIDLNGDGFISGQQEDASATTAGFISGGVLNLNRANASSQLVNYSANHTSFSVGGSYLYNDNTTFFARYSEGVRAVADRLLQIGGALNPDGSLTDTTSGFDEVEQLEIGVKYYNSDWRLNATLFDTTTQDTQAEVTSGLTFIREYEATGLELEGSYYFDNGFFVEGNATWTDAEISGDLFNPALIGNTPRRQADLIYTITPQYETDKFLVGVTIQGSSEYFVQDNNDLEQGAYAIFNLFATWYITDDFSASFNVNNLTDEFVITESEEGSAAVGDIVRARPLNGRTTNVSFRYMF
ncbi:TonB-dependent receptor [Alteromonadaceae bacterium M269]|nr:TonB-dependent receptor [Alteromonadaceae bacterium M269]